MNTWKGITQNDTDNFILDLLEITPSVQQNITFKADPPQNEMAMNIIFERRIVDYSGYKLDSIGLEDTISEEMHNSLLERSLVEFEGLWRSLAGK